MTRAVTKAQGPVTGPLSRTPKGARVRRHRRVGPSWRTAATTQKTARSVRTTTLAGASSGSVVVPATPGSYTYRAYLPATATRLAAESGQVPVTVVPAGPVQPHIITTHLPDGVVGVAYAGPLDTL